MVHFNFDEILVLIGELGRYQVILFALMGMTGVTLIWQNLAMVFIGADMAFWCADEDNVAEAPTWSDLYPKYNRNVTFPYNSTLHSPSQCTKTVLTRKDLYNATFPEILNASDFRTEKCRSWMYDRSAYRSTIVSQFNLVCDDEWKVSTATSLYMAGILAGVVTFGSISDRFGRHKTLVSCILLQVVSGVASAFAPEYVSFVFLRILVAASSAGAFTSGFVIVMETIGPTKRMTCGIFYQAWSSLGIMVQAAIAFYVRNHVHLQLVQALPGVLLLSYWWIVSESPRWLIFAGRTVEAEILVQRIAKINRREDVRLVDMIQRKQAGEIEDNEPKRKPNLLDILNAPILRLRTCNVAFHWFVICMVYYGLSLGSGDLGGSVYINHFLSGVVEIPSFFLAIFTMDRFGRKKLLMALHIFGGISCLACTPLMDIPRLQPLLVTCAMLGKFAVAANFAVIYVYSAEVFPTVVRNVGVGTGSMCARIGSLLAPQISRFDVLWRPTPFIFYGGLPLIAAVLVLFLPETLHQKLPETIEDGEKFGKVFTIYEKEMGKSETMTEVKSLTDPAATEL